MNLVKKAMSNKNFTDSSMESFSVSACCFAKKKNVFFDKITSLHLMCCHWKLVEKLIERVYLNVSILTHMDNL